MCICTCIAGNQSWLYSSSPVKIIKLFSVYLVYCSHGNWKFSAVRQVGLMTHGECRVDLLFPNRPIRWRVRTSPPPLQYGHWTTYLTPFLRLNPQIPKRCHMDLWLARLVLTHLHLHQHRHYHLLQQQILEPRVSVLSFQLWCFSLAGCPLALLVLQFRAAFSSLFFSNMSWE